MFVKQAGEERLEICPREIQVTQNGDKALHMQ